MTAKEAARVALTRDFLRAYEKLERKDVSRADWIALKFSCSLGEAERLIRLTDEP